MRLFKKTVVPAVTLMALLAGCGSNALEFLADKNSEAAKREEAQILIDKGDYDAAIALLLSACPNLSCLDPEDAQQLAAAYMGAAGLDVLDLVKSAEENLNSTALGSDFTAISSLLPDLTAENFTKIDSAVTLLQNIGNPTEDQTLQLSIAQLTAATIAIGQAGGGFDSNGVPVSCSGSCDATDTSDILNQTIPGTTQFVGNYVAAAINDSVNNINSLTSLADSDISDQMNDLAADMQNTTTTCATGGGTPTGDVVSTDVSNYLQYCVQ